MLGRNLVIVLSCALVVLAACATQREPRVEGVVAMKVTDAQAHVRMPNFAVQIGDRVLFVHRQCTPIPKAAAPSCREEIGGEGQVTQLLNAHDSVVALTPGSHYEEGDFVVLRRPPERAR